jgi:hypothetical protein
MAPKKARQIDGKHVHSSARIKSKNLPQFRAIETLKSCHLAEFVWSVVQRTKGFREAVFRDHILLKHHLSKCQLSDGMGPSVWIDTRVDFPLEQCFPTAGPWHQLYRAARGKYFVVEVF